MIGYLLIVRHLGRCVKGTLHGFVRELLTETTCAGQAGLLELSHNRRSQYGTCCCHRKLTRRIWEKTMNLPLSFLLESFLSERCTCHQEGPWIRLWAKQDDWPETTQKSTHYHKTWDHKPRGRAVLLSSLTLLLSALVPFLNKVSCFMCLHRKLIFKC